MLWSKSIQIRWLHFEIVLSKVVCFASDNKDIELGIIKAINEIAELYSLRGWVREPKPEKNIQTIEDEKIKNKKSILLTMIVSRAVLVWRIVL